MTQHTKHWTFSRISAQNGSPKARFVLSASVINHWRWVLYNFIYHKWFQSQFLGNTFYGQVTDNFTNMETYRKVMDVKNRSTDIFGISWVLCHFNSFNMIIWQFFKMTFASSPISSYCYSINIIDFWDPGWRKIDFNGQSSYFCVNHVVWLVLCCK